MHSIGTNRMANYESGDTPDTLLRLESVRMSMSSLLTHACEESVKLGINLKSAYDQTAGRWLNVVENLTRQ
jgi:hypothetical protein